MAPTESEGDNINVQRSTPRDAAYYMALAAAAQAAMARPRQEPNTVTHGVSFRDSPSRASMDSYHNNPQLLQPVHHQRPRKVYNGSPYPFAPSYEGSFPQTPLPQSGPSRRRSPDRSVSRGRRSRRSNSPKPRSALAGAPNDGTRTSTASQRIQRYEHRAATPLSTEQNASHNSPTPRSVSRGRTQQRAAAQSRLTFTDLIEQRSAPTSPQQSEDDVSHDGLVERTASRNDNADEASRPASQHDHSSPPEEDQARAEENRATIRETCSVLGELYSILEWRERERAARSRSNAISEQVKLPKVADQTNQRSQMSNHAKANTESEESLSLNATFEPPITARQHQLSTIAQADEEACFYDSDTDDIPSQPIPIPLSSNHRLLRSRQRHEDPLFENYAIQHRHDEVCKLRNTPPHLRRFQARRHARYQATIHTAQLVRRVQVPLPGSWYVNIPARQAQAIRNGATMNRDTDFIAPYAPVPRPVHVRRFASPADADLCALSQSINDSTPSFHSATSSVPRRQPLLNNMGANSSIEEGVLPSISSGGRHELEREEEDRFWRELGLEGNSWGGGGSWARSSSYRRSRDWESRH